jgi:hypothetical protein
MSDDPEFVRRADRLVEHAVEQMALIVNGIAGANGYASPAARTELLGTARSLRELAASLDIVVGSMEGQLSERKRQGVPADAPLVPRQP